MALSKKEYKRIIKILGREPTEAELKIFDVMWSEHCSYKSSKLFLKKFEKTTSYKHVMSKPGENAGIIKINKNLCLVMKIESHNHPSAVLPTEGAATGVGGIIRDILAMGANPIILLDSLYFGRLDKNKAKHYLNNVVSGISSYGNTVGIPVVGGETYFDDVYLEIPIVNVLCLGIVNPKNIVTSRTKVGNLILYVGATTGRDGLLGASFASQELASDGAKQHSFIQIPDPFQEKLLINALLELNQEGLIEGMQDMGAGGIAISAAELAYHSRVGIEIDIEKVPLRQTNMLPEEILLSESQERMLLSIENNPNKKRKIKKILNKWAIKYAIIGKTIQEEVLRINKKGKKILELPIPELASYPPLKRQTKRLKRSQPQSFKLKLPQLNYNEVFLKLITSENVASKKYIYQQYDYMVKTNTLVLPGEADAAVIWLKSENLAIAITVDGSCNYCAIEPRTGGMLAVCEALRNISCVGATPLAITNCLNFANPENIDVISQFKETIIGIAEAASFFKIPIISGNVSFYNEKEKISIFPTPVIGMVGLINYLDEKKIKDGNIIKMNFKNKNDIIIVLGQIKEGLGGSEFAKQMNIEDKLPQVSLLEEKKITDFCRRLISNEIISSAHDISCGGLASALVEAAVGSPDTLGIEASIKSITEELPAAVSLFSEACARIIISLPPQNMHIFIKLAQEENIPYYIIGKITGEDRFKIDDYIDLPMSYIKKLYFNSIEEKIKQC